MYPMPIKKPLTVLEALSRTCVEVHTNVGIRVLRRPESSKRWSIAHEAFLHISSLNGYSIYPSKRKAKRQAVSA